MDFNAKTLGIEDGESVPGFHDFIGRMLVDDVNIGIIINYFYYLNC